MIAEVSLPSTGLGIELGWADTFNKPIVCIYKTGSEFSNSLKAISNTFIEYSNTDDLIDRLAKLLEKQR